MYDPLEASALVVILPFECRVGVMYEPNIDGFVPLWGPSNFSTLIVAIEEGVLCSCAC